MDICLVRQNEWTNVHPTSCLGMLWLQTHFETEEWEALATKRAIISNKNAQLLINDAEDAGLTLSSVPSLTYSKKF